MPTPRSSPGVSTINGKLYVVGGFNNINCTLGTLEVYDPVANTWTTRASMLTLRRSFGAAAVGGILYAAGGAWVDNTTYLKTVEAYDPVSNAWTVKASMPATREWLGAVAMGGMVYAIGGTRTEFNLGSPLATVEAYQP